MSLPAHFKGWIFGSLFFGFLFFGHFPFASVAWTAEKAGADDFLHPLTQKDVNLYRRIFELQTTGKWSAANRLVKQLKNPVLMGHVLYQRYMHPTAYRSRYEELSDWMLAYPDHPGAKRIYDLARKKNGGKAGRLHKPLPARTLNFPADKPTRKAKQIIPAANMIDPTVSQQKSPYTKEERLAIFDLKTRVRRYLRRGQPERAEKRLWAFERQDILSDTGLNRVLSDITAGYFFDNQDNKALALGKIAAENIRDVTVQPDWISGLAAWRLGDCATAAPHFEKVAASQVAGDWMAAAGAFWAARAWLVCRQPDRVQPLLWQATRYPRTFYGLIAARQLGQMPVLNWTRPAFHGTQYQTISPIKAVQRAIALTQVGKSMWADMELTQSWRRADADQHAALLGLAARLGLAGTQLKIGKIEEQKRRTALDSTLYPLPDIIPTGGFTVDRALIFAIMRQESEFNSWAISHAGARGIMQVMPQTASLISRDSSLRHRNRIRLDDPQYNMALGQQYIQTMLGKNFADGDLFKTLVAYNAGPGNLRKWLRNTHFKNDPLLFIESIPARETRNYIERVISNYWIYRMRMNQSIVSLDRVSEGGWPLYVAQDFTTRHSKNNATNNGRNAYAAR